jgi:hypothetical protein
MLIRLLCGVARRGAGLAAYIIVAVSTPDPIMIQRMQRRIQGIAHLFSVDDDAARISARVLA